MSDLTVVNGYLVRAGGGPPTILGADAPEEAAAIGVKIGGDLRVGVALEIPAGSVWQVSGDLAIDGGACLTIGNDAELRVGQAEPVAKGRKAGLHPPDWALIEMVARLYQERGHQYLKQNDFVSWLNSSSLGNKLGLGSLSLRTFQRWLKTYEAVTREKVRPGRGKRRRQL